MAMPPADANCSSANSSSDSPVVVANAAHEIEAAMMVGLLNDHGIQTHMAGEFTAGFRAEVPGSVSVMVHPDDQARAKQLLDEVQARRAQQDHG